MSYTFGFFLKPDGSVYVPKDHIGWTASPFNFFLYQESSEQTVAMQQWLYARLPNFARLHQKNFFIMSPPVGLGDILFLPWSSVRLLQNRVRSVTPKLFEIFSWNFTQM